jgi:cell division septation protein DedD
MAPGGGVDGWRCGGSGGDIRGPEQAAAAGASIVEHVMPAHPTAAATWPPVGVTLQGRDQSAAAVARSRGAAAAAAAAPGTVDGMYVHSHISDLGTGNGAGGPQQAQSGGAAMLPAALRHVRADCTCVDVLRDVADGAGGEGDVPCGRLGCLAPHLLVYYAPQPAQAATSSSSSSRQGSAEPVVCHALEAAGGSTNTSDVTSGLVAKLTGLW